MAIKLNTSLRPQARPESDAFGPRPTDSPLRSTAQTFGNIAKAAGNIESIVDRADNQAQSLVGLEAYTNFTNEFKAAAIKLKNVYTSGDESAITAEQEEFDSRFKDPDFNNFRPEGVTKQLTRESVLTNYRAQARSQYENNASKNEMFLNDYNANKVIIDKFEQFEKGYNTLVASYPEGVPTDEALKGYNKFIEEDKVEASNIAYEKYKEQDNFNLANGRETKLAETYLKGLLSDFEKYSSLMVLNANTPNQVKALRAVVTKHYNDFELFNKIPNGMESILNEIQTRENAVNKNKGAYEKDEALRTYTAFDTNYSVYSNASTLNQLLSGSINMINAGDNVMFPGQLSEEKQARLNDANIIKELLLENDMPAAFQQYILSDNPGPIDQYFNFNEVGLSGEGLRKLNSIANKIIGTFNESINVFDVPSAMSAIDPEIKNLIDSNDFLGADKLYRDKYLPTFIKQGNNYPNHLTDNSITGVDGKSSTVTSSAVNDMSKKAMANPLAYNENVNALINNNVYDNPNERLTAQIFNVTSNSDGTIDTNLLDQTSKGFEVLSTTPKTDPLYKHATEIYNFALDKHTRLLEDPEDPDNTSLFGMNEPEYISLFDTLKNQSITAPEQEQFYENLIIGNLMTSLKTSDNVNEAIGKLEEFDKQFSAVNGVSRTIDPNNSGIDTPIQLPNDYSNDLVDFSRKIHTGNNTINMLKTFGIVDNADKGKINEVAQLTFVHANIQFFSSIGDPDIILKNCRELGIDFDIDKDYDPATSKPTEEGMRSIIKGLYGNRIASDSQRRKFLGIPFPNIIIDDAIFDLDEDIALGYKPGTTFEPSSRLDTGARYIDGKLVETFIPQFRTSTGVYKPVSDRNGNYHDPSIEDVKEKVKDHLKERISAFDIEFSLYGETGQVLDRALRYYYD